MTVRFDKEFIDCSIGSLAETYPILQNLQPMAFFDFMFDDRGHFHAACQTNLAVCLS